MYTLQPNPDDIYLYSPIRGDLRYRVSGNRGTVRILNFTTQRNMSGMVDDISQIGGHNDLDDQDIAFEENGDFELLFSVEPPAGHSGNWAPVAPDATGMMVRLRSYDWMNERNPELCIECLDQVPPKPRLRPEDIATRIKAMARFPVRKSRLYYQMQNGIRGRVGVNVFEPIRLQGALTKQVYWPAVFELEDGEPLAVGLYGTRMANIMPGDRILLLGAGSVALCTLYWARRLGAGRMVAMSRSERRAPMAREMGADVFVQYGDNEFGEVAEALGGAADIVFECAGAPGLIDKGIRHVRAYGQVLSMGFCAAPDTLLPAMAGLKGVSLQFPVGYSLKDFQYVADTMDKGYVDPKVLISSVVPLDELPTVFEQLGRANRETKIHISA